MIADKGINSLVNVRSLRRRDYSPPFPPSSHPYNEGGNVPPLWYNFSPGLSHYNNLRNSVDPASMIIMREYDKWKCISWPYIVILNPKLSTNYCILPFDLGLLCSISYTHKLHGHVNCNNYVYELDNNVCCSYTPLNIQWLVIIHCTMY